MDELPDRRVVLRDHEAIQHVDGFLGPLLAGKTKKVATLDEIKQAAAAGWTHGRKE